MSFLKYSYFIRRRRIFFQTTCMIGKQFLHLSRNVFFVFLGKKFISKLLPIKNTIFFFYLTRPFGSMNFTKIYWFCCLSVFIWSEYLKPTLLVDLCLQAKNSDEAVPKGRLSTGKQTATRPRYYEVYGEFFFFHQLSQNQKRFYSHHLTENRFVLFLIKYFIKMIFIFYN